MNSGESKWVILGQGLAGTCLAWALWEKREPFLLIDRGFGGSSRVAAGLINPLTGKNFEPSWRISEFLPQALGFYAEIEKRIGRKIWYPFPILRLAASARELEKIQSKLSDSAVAPWVRGMVPAPEGWLGAVDVRGGGRVDTVALMDGSREFFQSQGCFQSGEFPNDLTGERIVRCDGSEGLLTGSFGPHRCAKGEILTVRADGWDPGRIRIGAGGWLVPLGDGVFKVGSTYEWNELNEEPTQKGRERVEEIADRLGGGPYQVLSHVAGIRPILRRSQPLIGRMAGGGWMFNALGSKGALYAPRMGRLLADWLLQGIEPEPEVDLRYFLKDGSSE